MKKAPASSGISISDIAGCKQTEEELLNLRAAIEQSANTIIITDSKGVIEYVNPAFEKSTGYSSAEVVGKHSRLLKSGKQDAAFYRDLWETITSGGTWRGQFHNKRKGGAFYWDLATISPVTNNQGEIVRFIGIKEDISTIKSLEFSLHEELHRAKVATHAKSDFLANMSHEIRTPINGIIGMTDLLLTTPQTPEQHVYAESIHSCGDSLLAIINDILDFSKVEAGKLVLESLDFDIRTTIEHTIEILAIRAQQKGIDVVYMIAEEIPKILRGDPSRLRQILFNLVGNAIKFTHRGGVTVKLDLLDETDASVTLRVAVADTGIGIPEDKQEAVFSQFIQADQSTARQYGGTGLGLAICRQLVHLFQGEMSLTSEEGKGSTFCFTAMLQKSSAESLRPARNEADLSGVKVLVTDDFKTNRVFITKLLENWGCRFAEACDGPSALAILKEAAQAREPFAAALLDMHMPGMDGAELGRRIKNDPDIKSTRLVMLTSLGRRGDAEALAGVGFSGYLPKPIRPALLRKCLALVMGREEPSTGFDQALITRHTVAETARRRLRVLVAEDNTINRIIAIKMLEKLGHVAEGVTNGMDAIESLRGMPYDLVLMDCQMPVMDGFEATRIIRDPGSGVRNPRVPIIAITAHAMKGDRDLCINAGMNDYVSKPTKVRDIAAAIDRCVPGMSRFGDPVPVADTEAAPAPRDFDREGFLERMMGDSDLASETVKSFLADSPPLLDGLSEAILAGDAASACKFAHMLKGASANMGGEILSQITAQMQDAGNENNLPRLSELFPHAQAAYRVLCSNLQKFQFPGTQPQHEGPEAAVMNPPETPVKVLVLVVEDDPNSRKLTGKILQKLGYSAEFAADGTEALKSFVPGKYFAILMDMAMPTMDGIDATRRIREIEGAAEVRVPIIALTANVMLGDRESCLIAGMDAFLSKPFKSEDLAEKLASFTQSRL